MKKIKLILLQIELKFVYENSVVLYLSIWIDSVDSFADFHDNISCTESEGINISAQKQKPSWRQQTKTEP